MTPPCSIEYDEFYKSKTGNFREERRRRCTASPNKRKFEGSSENTPGPQQKRLKLEGQGRQTKGPGEQPSTEVDDFTKAYQDAILSIWD